MGGPSNPPDKPYVVKTLPDDDDQATAELQAARDAGFEVLFAIPFRGEAFGSDTKSIVTRVILGNYGKNEK